MKFDSKTFINQTKQMNEAIEALREEYQAKIQASFHEATKAFFVATPDVQALEWTQYTPYWNDGEETEFGVHDVWYYLSFQDPEDDDWDGGESAGFGYGDKAPDETELQTHIDSLIALIDSGPSPLTSAQLEKHPDKYYIADGKYIDRGYSLNRDYVYTYNPLKAKQHVTKLEEELKVVRDNASVYAKKNEIVKNVEAIRSFVAKIGDEVMKDMFGDHVRVRVTAEEVTTYEYDHE